MSPTITRAVIEPRERNRYRPASAVPIGTHGVGLLNPRGSLTRYARHRVPAGHICTALTATHVLPTHARVPHASAHGRDSTTSYVSWPVQRCGPSQLGGGKHAASGSLTLLSSGGGGVIEFPQAVRDKSNTSSAERSGIGVVSS
jgi:hypothetical protein